MNPRNAPLSPVSVGGSELTASPNNDKHAYPFPTGGRAPLSPPSSGTFSPTMNGFPPGPQSVAGPSPPPSIAGRTSYARSESGRSAVAEGTEGILGEHYVALKRYLAATSKDGRANPPPNRARDKLLRLSSVQFLELSMDVYDELLRRQAFARKPPNAPPNAGPPAYLLPENTFHPKRNQARQKLSTLGQPRFRDLATDVFCELERRLPRFAQGDIPRPPRRRPDGRMRRPSDASSIRSAAGPPRIGDYPAPPSPGMPPGGFDRRLQSNTIVPNKSTMVEEDDDGIASPDEDSYGMGLVNGNRQSKRSAGSSETDKKLIDDYQAQVAELREKLDNMEDQMKKKDDELNNLIDERTRSSPSDAEKQEWDEARASLESRLTEAQSLNDSLRDDIERMRDDHEAESHRLRQDLDEARQVAGGAGGDSHLAQENQDLRTALEEQQHVTQEAQRELRQFFDEMKVLSQKHTPSWDRQTELEKANDKLEEEVREWRNRYALAKTQVRDMRGSSSGLGITNDAAKYVREKGFTHDTGLVKDVHVTKFQMSVDELLQHARTDDPAKAIDFMKAVVANVRRIMKDIESSTEGPTPQQQKMKARVSATANNLITACKNFASAAGISPVSLVDAAASHLVASLVELLRIVKIRDSPEGELDEEENGTVTPPDSAGFFSKRNTNQQDDYGEPNGSPLAPPPPFQGLRGMRDSTQSSAYSPIASPRDSDNHYTSIISNGNSTVNGAAAHTDTKDLPPMPNGYHHDTNIEDLKYYLGDQQSLMIQNIQTLVDLVRRDGPPYEIIDEIDAIVGVVDNITGETETSGYGSDKVQQLAASRQRMMEAGDHGHKLASEGLQSGDRDWRMWTQTLPPAAFEIKRMANELIQSLGQPPADDFS